jgi:predicted RNA-binding protein with PIN domain
LQYRAWQINVAAAAAAAAVVVVVQGAKRHEASLLTSSIAKARGTISSHRIHRQESVARNL